MKRRISFVAVLTLLAFLFCVNPAIADAVQELTIEQALERGLENSSDLSQSEYNVEINKIIKDEVWDSYNVLLMQTYIPGTDLHVSIPSDVDFEEQVYATNLQWMVAKKEYEMKVDSILTSMLQKYFAVKEAEKDCQAKTKILEREEEKLNITEARYNVGMETDVSLASARAAYLAAKAGLIDADNALANAYIELNKLLGIPLDSRPLLVDSAQFEILEIDDPEQTIQEITANSPTVWISDEQVRFYKQTTGMNQYNSYKLDKAELNKAEAGLELTKEQVSQLTRDIYYKIKNLEEAYAASSEKVKITEKVLCNAKIFYEVGMSTKADVVAAEAAYAEAESSLLALTCQHNLLKSVFYKPWTAGVILGG